MQTKSHKDLIVWQRGIELVDEIYRATTGLPKEELYGLISQMRRAAVSIPSNIAEGYKRKHLGEYTQFLGVADGSAAELETQLIIIERQYPNAHTESAKKALEEVQKMLYAMQYKLNTQNSRPKR